MQRLKAFGLRLLEVLRKKIQNSEEGEEETKKIYRFILVIVIVIVLVVTKQLHDRGC